MKVTNTTGFHIIAFAWHSKYGYGDDVVIPSEMTVDVSGPYIGEMGGGDCFMHIPGEIICHESCDDDEGFQVGLGTELVLQNGEFGLTARHADEHRKIPSFA